MGSPLRPTLANAFLWYYKKLWLDNCLTEFKNVVYRIYIDDIFVLFKSKDHLLSFARYMNTRHEQNNSLSFLDIKIIRGSKGFSTSDFS